MIIFRIYPQSRHGGPEPKPWGKFPLPCMSLSSSPLCLRLLVLPLGIEPCLGVLLTRLRHTGQVLALCSHCCEKDYIKSFNINQDAGNSLADNLYAANGSNPAALARGPKVYTI